MARLERKRLERITCLRRSLVRREVGLRWRARPPSAPRFRSSHALLNDRVSALGIRAQFVLAKLSGDD